MFLTFFLHLIFLFSCEENCLKFIVIISHKTFILKLKLPNFYPNFLKNGSQIIKSVINLIQGYNQILTHYLVISL
jgi:hypothetical protein